MHLSSRGEYALKALAFLQRRARGGALVTTSEICSACGLPTKYLEQILLQLKQAGILDSKRGQSGGWKLAREAKTISLGDAIRTVDGRFTPVPSFLSIPSDDEVMDLDALRELWTTVRDAVRSIMDQTPITILVGDCPEATDGFGAGKRLVTSLARGEIREFQKLT